MAIGLFLTASPAIAQTLRIATAGDYDIALPKLNLSRRQVPIDDLERAIRRMRGRLRRKADRSPSEPDQPPPMGSAKGRPV